MFINDQCDEQMGREFVDHLFWQLDHCGCWFGGRFSVWRDAALSWVGL